MNLRELLEHEGMLIIHTPNIFTPRRISRYLIKRKQMGNYFKPENISDFHLTLYDYLTLEKTLNFVGLKVIEVVPTKFAPFKNARPSKLLSRMFPFLSETLLFKCQKCDPIDIEKQISFWVENWEKYVK